MQHRPAAQGADAAHQTASTAFHTSHLAEQQVLRAADLQKQHRSRKARPRRVAVHCNATPAAVGRISSMISHMEPHHCRSRNVLQAASTAAAAVAVSATAVAAPPQRMSLQSPCGNRTRLRSHPWVCSCCRQLARLCSRRLFRRSDHETPGTGRRQGCRAWHS